MELKECIVKTKVNFSSFALLFIGMVIFGYFAYIVLISPIKSNYNFNENNLSVIKWIIFGVFVFIFIILLYFFLTIKIFTLTNQNIIIDYPFISIKKVIPISSIKKVFEKNNIYRFSRGRILYDNMIFKEKETIIELIDGRKIKVDLLIAENYLEFKRRLSELIETKVTTL